MHALWRVPIDNDVLPLFYEAGLSNILHTDEVAP